MDANGDDKVSFDELRDWGAHGRASRRSGPTSPPRALTNSLPQRLDG